MAIFVPLSSKVFINEFSSVIFPPKVLISDFRKRFLCVSTNIPGSKSLLIGFQTLGTEAKLGLEGDDGTIWRDSSQTINLLPKLETNARRNGRPLLGNALKKNI